MSRKALAVVLVTTLSLAGLSSIVYAHCGKCATDAKYFADSIKKSDVTLAKATSTAEKDCNGTAVHATTMRTDDGVKYEVHCLADGKIMAVVVGGDGKVMTKEEVKDLDSHAKG